MFDENGGDLAASSFVRAAADLLRLITFIVSEEILGESSRSVSPAVLVAPTDVEVEFFDAALVRRRMGAAWSAALLLAITRMELLFLCT